VLFLFVDAIEADRDSDHQGVVLAGRDVHAVGVAHPEPRPRDPRHHAVPVSDLEVLVQQVPDRLEPLAARQVDVGPVVQRREHGLVHGGHHRAVVLDLHRVGERQQLVLDRGQHGARSVLELEGVPQRQDLGVDEERTIATIIGDPEVILDREDLLPHEIAHDRQAISVRRPRAGRPPARIPAATRTAENRSR